MRLPQQYRPMPRRILIVGDPAVGRGLMKLVLDRLGYVVSCTASAGDALVAVGHTRFALIIVALKLPDLPGLALARRLRAANGPAAGVPLLLFGDAWDRAALAAECHELRVEAYLPKPISIGRLVEAVRELTRSAVEGSPGATRMTPAPSPVDARHFLSFTDGDVVLEGELAELYLTTALDYLERMRAHLDDPTVWGAAAHALKGASANIGATSMAALAAAAECADPAAATLGRMETALDEVARFFRQRIRPLAEPMPALLPASA